MVQSGSDCLDLEMVLFHTVTSDGTFYGYWYGDVGCDEPDGSYFKARLDLDLTLSMYQVCSYPDEGVLQDCLCDDLAFYSMTDADIFQLFRINHREWDWVDWDKDTERCVLAPGRATRMKKSKTSTYRRVAHSRYCCADFLEALSSVWPLRNVY
jgi:hypothetical protein